MTMMTGSNASNKYSNLYNGLNTSSYGCTMFGKPAEWWLQISQVLELHGIGDYVELEKRLPPLRAADDWSGY